eukprot:GHVU01040884.1.p2 GENE.GHVU01040884.1~~GHVU01040884.1.p2  ORF type:complete len:129 (+),score=9.18 GHVU01040884.1:316-702(+)
MTFPPSSLTHNANPQHGRTLALQRYLMEQTSLLLHRSQCKASGELHSSINRSTAALAPSKPSTESNYSLSNFATCFVYHSLSKFTSAAAAGDAASSSPSLSSSTTWVRGISSSASPSLTSVSFIDILH